MSLRVLVTRPRQQAEAWVQHLRAAGLQADALPLIAIEPLPDPHTLHEAWRSLSAQSLVFFVSPNAVAQFFAARPADAAWPDGVPAATAGPGSAAALRAQGVPAEDVIEPPPGAAQFDSETLWHACLASRDWAGRAVLIVRGDGGREWLADTLAAHGALPRFVQAYARTLPALDDAQRRLLSDALAQPRRHLWLFSSAQAIDHLQRLAPGHADWASARALATHPRIAERARALGVAQVVQSQPSESAVVTAIQGIR